MGLSQREKDELELLELEEAEAQAQAKPKAAEAGKPGLLETIARMGTKGLTFGLADEASGLLGAGGEILTGQSSPKDALSLYQEYRDAYRKGDKAAAAANPSTALVSELAGGLLTPNPVGKLSAGRLAARAIGQGALNAVGNSEAEMPADLAKDAATGAVLGLGGHAIGSAASHLIPTAQATKQFAIDQAIRHLRPTPNVARSLGPKKLGEIAQEALDSGAIQFGANAGATAEKLSAGRQAAYDKMAKILEDSKAMVNPGELRAKIQKEVLDPLNQFAENESIVNDLTKRADALLSKHGGYGPAYKEVPASLIEKEKSIAQNKINWTAEPKAKTDAEKAYARAIKESSEEAIASASGDSDKAYKSAKKAYGDLKSAQKMAERTGGLTMGGTGLMGGLTDLGVGLEALREARQGNYGVAGLLGGARALTRGRVNSSLAASANTLANALIKRGKTNEALKIIESLVKQAPEVAARQNGPYYENSNGK